MLQIATDIEQASKYALQHGLVDYTSVIEP